MALYLVYIHMPMLQAVCAPLIEVFCRAIDSKSSKRQYRHRLNAFDTFLKKQYNIPIDSFIAKTKSNKIDLYEIIGEYRIQLKQDQHLEDQTIGSRVGTVKHFLEYNSVPINNTQFRLKVKPPKRRQRTKNLKALDHALVRKIILACQDTRLQTYVLLLAATGMRATEALSIRYKDIDWEEGTVELRAEYTKTQDARTVLLTQECLKHLRLWKDYRERERRIVRRHKIIHIRRLFELTDLFFTTGRGRKVVNPFNLYYAIIPDFRATLERNGLTERYDNKGKRRKISFHRFRSFVLSTISDLGHGDYGEGFIGHSGSTYYRKTDAEKLEIFKKIEPYLTYLDYSSLETHGADIETKLSEKDKRIEHLESQMQDISKAMNIFLGTQKKLGYELPLEIIAHRLSTGTTAEELKKGKELNRKYGIDADEKAKAE
jgi:integrase